jgi:hypothetical protein
MRQPPRQEYTIDPKPAREKTQRKPTAQAVSPNHSLSARLPLADIRGVKLRPAILLAIGLLSVPAWGPNPRLAVTQFGHDVWTTSNGLPQDSVRAIAQTADGYL